MAEIIPTLAVYRRVQNIEQEHLDDIQAQLLEKARDESPFAEEIIPNLFSQASNLWMPIITKGEFIRLQTSLGPDMLSEDEVKALKSRLEAKGAKQPKTVDMNTLPAKLDYWGKAPRRLIAVARDEEFAIAEARLMQNIVLGAMSPQPSRDLFRRDRKIGFVQIGRSKNEEELDLLRQGIHIVTSERPLPHVTKLGPIEYDYIDARLRH